MAWFPIPDIGEHGIIDDIAPHLLPPGAWSSGENVHFRNGKIRRRGSSQQVYTGIGSNVADNPYWGINIDSGADSFWVYSSLTHLYALIGTRVLPITRSSGPYAMTLERLWNGGILSGIVVLNNGVDIPQFWKPSDLNNPLTNRAADLAAWPDDRGIDGRKIRAKVLRPFGYFLVAFNITENNQIDFNRIRWSTSAVPGTLPVSWSVTDPAIDAGETDLPDPSGGEIVDARRLRDWLIIYKNNSTWAMRYIGGPDVFTFTEVFPNLGILESDCVAPFSHKGGQYHCMFTGDDVKVHDGRSIIHDLEGRLARYISANLSADNWRRSFVVNLPQINENWICYPTNNEQAPHQAIAWNYDEDTLSLLDFPDQLSWITRGIAEGHNIGLTWNSDVTEVQWDRDLGRWNEASIQQRNLRPVGFIHSGADRGIWQMNESTATEEFASYIERRNFAYILNEQTLSPLFDPGREKLIHAIRLYFEDNDVAQNMDLTVVAKDSFGEGAGRRIQATFNTKSGPPHWDLLGGQGRSFDFRIEPKSTHQSMHWELVGMEIDIEVANTFYGAGTLDTLGARQDITSARTPFGRGRII